MIAATTKDGRIHLLDSASMAGAAVRTAPYSTAADFLPGALSTWQAAAGTRWILAPTGGPGSAAAHFSASNGAVANTAIVACKVACRRGGASLRPGFGA